VLATSVGGVPEALGFGADGNRPGRLIPPDDPAALADALRQWLTDPGTRERWRAAARERRPTLQTWSETARRLDQIIDTREPRSEGAPR
jgi:glycosyltransferase involved in cell wall biosynthesis